MLPTYADFLIKRFTHPDEVRMFEKGKFEIVKIGSMIRLRRSSGAAGDGWRIAVASEK
jgi:hypothetical protein